MRIKILHIEGAKTVTGSFIALMQTCYLLESDFDSTLLLPSNSPCLEEAKKKKVKAEALYMVQLSRRLNDIVLFIPFIFINAISISRRIKKEKITILHLNDLYFIAPYLLRFFFPHVKIVTHIRLRKYSLSLPYYNYLIKLALKRADKIVCVSDIVIQDSPLLQNNPKVERIYDSAYFEEKIPYHYQTQDQNGNVKLLYLSNYTPGKGHDLMLLVFEKAFKQNPSLHLTFAGDDFGLTKNKTYKNALVKKASELGLQANITFLGKTDDTEFLYKTHQIFVNLSQYESFSYTCMEALFYGIPCLAYNSGGPYEILEGGAFGVLLESREAEKVSEKLIGLISDAAQREKLSKEGRSYIRTKFNAAECKARYLNLFNSLGTTH